MKEKHLREPFEKIGEVERVEIVRDRLNTESRGFGFVYYRENADAHKAVAELNKTELHGKTIVVEIAKRCKPRGPTPGKYLGKFKSRSGRGSSRHGGSRSRSPSYRRSSKHRSSRYDDRRDDRRGEDRMRRSSRDYRHGYEERGRKSDNYKERDRSI